jgi:hypothetical protein
MRDEEETVDLSPKTFESEEAAGEFWETHSLTDYEEHPAADDVTFEIGERVFEVQVAEDVFKKLQEQAESVHQSAPKIVDKILRHELIDSYRRRAPGTSSIPIWLLLAMFPVAFLLFWLPEKLFPNWTILVATLAHTGSALIVASIIGLTYEYFVHKHREKALQEILLEHQRKMYEAVQAYGKTTPKEVFGLLGDIATQTNKMPTLYRPPREKAGEYTFANSCDFFETIIKVQGTEVIDILDKWITAENSHLQFLASDFVGRYELAGLTEKLRKHAEPKLQPHRWKLLTKEEKHCTLNYVWAVSRCEKPRYKWLKELLLNPPAQDPTVPEWMLFIPQQMPEDYEFLEIIKEYLERGLPIGARTQEVVRRSLIALDRQLPGKGTKLLNHFSHVFSEIDAQAQAQRDSPSG